MARKPNKKSTLKLVPTAQPEPAKEEKSSKASGCASCFFTKCPRKLDFYPETACPMGKPEFTSKGNILKEPDCEWWINSPQDNYCFWSYIKRESFEDGTMRPLKQSEIAKFFGCSSTKIYFILKGAIEKLKTGGDVELLTQFYEESEEREHHDNSIYHPDMYGSSESSDILSDFEPED